MPVNFRSLIRAGRKATVAVDAQDFRALAQRCRDLLQVAVRPEVKEQLREWVVDFENEAEALEGRCSGRTADAEAGEG
jgi:hypothetical protein